MHILDTDTLSHLHAGNQNVVRAIQQLHDPDISTTIITKIEMLRGWMDYILKAQADQDLLRAQQLFCRTEELLFQIEVMVITQDSANRLAELVAMPKLRKIGHWFRVMGKIDKMPSK
jgi:tRNA(fMet)-specific endonuclease VapC